MSFLIQKMSKLQKNLPKVWYNKKNVVPLPSSKVSIYIINNFNLYKLWHM